MSIESQEPAIETTTLVDAAGVNTATISATGAVKVDGSAVTQPISAASLPLPTGAATAVAQTTENASLASMLANQTNGTQEVSIGTAVGKTLVLKTGTLATTAVTANQVVLTYTVTAGKTLYLEYLHMDGFETTLPGNANPIALGTITLQVAGVASISVDYFHPPDKALLFPFGEPLPVAAGVVIRVVVTPAITTSITWRANFGGYER
jgi:hypothetical protein